MTTTEDQIITDDASTDAPTPLRLTYDALCDLDVCGEYLSTHSRLYPVSEYPQGPALTEEECARHVNSWNWEWAEAQLLTYPGQELYRNLRSSRAAENRRFGTGMERRARVMGYILHHRPDMRSSRLVEACASNDEKQARRALVALDSMEERLRSAKHNLAVRQERLASAEREVADIEKRLLSMRAAAGPALRRRAEQRAEQAARAVEAEERRAAERLAELRAEAERIAAELAQLDEQTTQTTPSTTDDAK